MNIVFTSKIRQYRTGCFPKNLHFVPRVRECVGVVPAFHDYMNEQGLPLYLVVNKVIHTESGVFIELVLD